MPTMANWNGHTFVVSPGLIRSFTDLNIKGSCETTTKNTDKQKYVEHKYGEIPEVNITVPLNALTGVTNVYAEAMEYVREAQEGACAYFYLGSSKLIPAQMMLVNAEITEVATMPGKGDQWISCDVKLKFLQGSDSDGSAYGSGGGNGDGSQKASVNTHSLKGLLTGEETLSQAEKDAMKTGLSTMKRQLQEAKMASNGGFAVLGGLQYQTLLVDKAVRAQSDSADRLEATTGRCEITNAKITLVPKVKPQPITPDTLR